MRALLFDVNIPKFLVIQLLRPLSPRFCYGGPFATVKLGDIPEPTLPSPEWVKIRTRLCGFCGSDLNLILLKDSPTASPFTSFPCVPGHELCGDIVEAGDEVKAFHPGELVTVAPMLNCTTRGITPVCRSCREGRPANCENYAEGRLSPGMFTGICKDINGGFAEVVVAHQSQVYPVPPGVSPEAATLTEPLAVALQAVLDNLPQNQEKILIIGGGVIGSLLVKTIRALDIACHITVTEPSPFQAAYIEEAGADHVIKSGLMDEATTITGGRAYKPMLGDKILMGGFDRVYDTVGHSPTLNSALRVTATGGTISVIGIGKAVKLDLTPLWLKLQTVKGSYAYGYNTTEDGPKQAFQMALDMMKDGRIEVEDMLTHTFHLEDYR
ncbi:MAG: alcohol dehydrogenase catalytic domain-containing protein, partial [Deltaproteobacteria bacterium]|nr:alcohol dehydrogenase catalytic domain-containing protein [Deltaproteobacteria bacterium]